MMRSGLCSADEMFSVDAVILGVIFLENDFKFVTKIFYSE